MRLSILLCLLLSFQVFAQTSLWKVSNADSILYLGGTIHLLSPDDYPLPEEFLMAYQRNRHGVSAINSNCLN